MVKNDLSILMILKTPPPFGGGELQCAALKKHVENNPGFKIIEINSKTRNKTNQGKFNFWKMNEFFRLWLRVLSQILWNRPALIFCPVAKSFPHFLRDSLLFWTAWLFRVPFAGELAGATFYFLGENKRQTLYGKLVLSRFCCLRVLGDGIAAHLRTFGIENTIVSDNGIDLPLKNSLNPDSKTKDAPFRILFVGTLSEQKGFSTLVDACGKLADEGCQFEVHTMGEWGSENFKHETEKRIRQKGLSKHLILHGLTHGKRKAELYAGTDVLVLPSYIEGQPLVILEALSYGIPVISTCVGGIPDTIKDEQNGFIIQPGDSVELGEKIRFLMQTPKICQRMSQANSTLYLKRFTEAAFLKTQVYWLEQAAHGQLNPKGQFVQSP